MGDADIDLVEQRGPPAVDHRVEEGIGLQTLCDRLQEKGEEGASSPLDPLFPESVPEPGNIEFQKSVDVVTALYQGESVQGEYPVLGGPHRGPSLAEGGRRNDAMLSSAAWHRVMAPPAAERGVTGLL